MSRWFRVDDGLVDDPKVQQLPDRLFRDLINIWCVFSQNSAKMPPISQLKFKLRTTEKKTKKIIEELRAAGLLDEDENGKLSPHNWHLRQFTSDVTDPTAAERQRRYRYGKKRNAAVTHKRPYTDTDTDTDTDKEREEADASSLARKRASRLSPDWWPTLDNINYAIGKGLNQQRINVEAEKFRNYWIAKGGTGATKLNWDATWQNWILNACERGGSGNGPTESLSDRAFRLAERARSAERAPGVDRPVKPVRGD